MYGLEMRLRPCTLTPLSQIRNLENKSSEMTPVLHCFDCSYTMTKEWQCFQLTHVDRENGLVHCVVDIRCGEWQDGGAAHSTE